MKRCITFMLVCAVALSGLCGNVWSQEQTSPDQLFQQGVDLAIQKDYQQAIAIWLPLLQIENNESKPKILKATALAYKKLKKLPEAWYYFSLYRRSTPQDDSKAAKWLKGVEEKLSKGHEKVVLSCEPEGVALNFGPQKIAATGQPISNLEAHYPCPLTWWFRPGKHDIQAAKQGFVSQLVEIEVLELGDQGVRKIELLAVAPELAPPKVVVIEEKTPTPGTTINQAVGTAQKSNLLEWVLVGSGAAVVATGGVLQILANSRNESLHEKYVDKATYPDGGVAKGLYDSDYDEEVRPKRTTAFVLYGVGGAAIIAGAVLMALDDGGAVEESKPVTIGPAILPGGAAAQMSVTF